MEETPSLPAPPSSPPVALTGTQSPQPSPGSKSSFMKLPTEIRLQVYNLVFADEHMHVDAKKTSKTGPEGEIMLPDARWYYGEASLLLVSKKVYEEAIKPYYENCDIHLGCDSNFSGLRVLAVRMPLLAAHIKQLQFCWALAGKITKADQMRRFRLFPSLKSITIYSWPELESLGMEMDSFDEAMSYMKDECDGEDAVQSLTTAMPKYLQHLEILETGRNQHVPGIKILFKIMMDAEILDDEEFYEVENSIELLASEMSVRYEGEDFCIRKTFIYDTSTKVATPEEDKLTLLCPEEYLAQADDDEE